MKPLNRSSAIRFATLEAGASVEKVGVAPDSKCVGLGAQHGVHDLLGEALKQLPHVRPNKVSIAVYVLS